MNKLALSGTVWIASDIHLDAAIPRTAAAFYQFLAQARDEADALILCGDIFDAWVGDDDALGSPPAWLDEALRQLRLTATTLPLWIMRGNRDFLIGQALAQALGASLLESPALLASASGDILLAHGDEYCLDDAGYQRFRRIVHTAWVQRVFLALPLGLRRSIARQARARSRRARGSKPLQVMDVQPAAIAQALRTAGCLQMIHGHTHRPATHEFLLDGRPAHRYVLPDWDYDQAAPPRGGWIAIDHHGIRPVAPVPHPVR